MKLNDICIKQNNRLSDNLSIILIELEKAENSTNLVEFYSKLNDISLLIDKNIIYCSHILEGKEQ